MDVDKVEMPHDAKLEALRMVYAMAENIYQVKHKKTTPEGRTFSRNLDEDAEASYKQAAIEYLRWVNEGMPNECPQDYI